MALVLVAFMAVIGAVFVYVSFADSYVTTGGTSRQEIAASFYCENSNYYSYLACRLRLQSTLNRLFESHFFK